MNSSALRDAAIVAGYRSAWWAVRTAPPVLSRPAFDAAADLAWRRDGRGVRRLRWNLARVRPDLGEAALDDLVRAAMRSYLRYWCEAFRLPALGRDHVVDAMEAEGEENLRTPLAEGRGVVVALPHLANWDLAGAWVAATTGGISAVAERLRPDGVFDLFLGYRRSIGMTVYATDDRAAFGALQDTLRSGGVVALVADRDLSSSGVSVEFFGHEATMPPGPAALALRTGAVLLPCGLSYGPDGGRVGRLRAVIGPAVEARSVRAATQEMARRFETRILQAPQDWHMLQRIWPDMPREGRARAERGTA